MSLDRDWLCKRELIDVAETVCAGHGLTLAELRKRDRRPERVAVRRRVSEALRELGASYPLIGEVLRREHASIMNLLKPKAR